MPTIQPIKFDAGNVDINIDPPSNLSELKDALINNQPFPEDILSNDGAISLGSIKASASGKFKLDKISFSADGGAFAGFGVYRSTEKLFADLKTGEGKDNLIKNLNFPGLAQSNLLALRWGYNAEGTVSGNIPNIAFGAGLSFSAGAGIEQVFAVLRLLPRNTKSVDAIKETISSWKMPRQVATPNDLRPGTWLVSETDGQLKLSLGVNYGYDFSWVRNDIEFKGLSGDLGLKIEMGVKTAFGFNAAGHYTVVLCREDDSNKLRLQVYKLKSHGWNFAFDASITGQVKQDLIPDNFDEFIKGIFNLQGSQVFKDFEKWLDPNTTLANLLGAELIDQAKDLVKKTTGFDPETEFNKGLEKLQEVIKKWSELPHEVTSFLYGFLKENKSLEKLKEFLKFINDKTDKELKDEITNQLKQVDFFENQVGKWLMAAVDKGILSVLANFEKEHEELKKRAGQTLALLDGSKVEETLKKLQDWVESKLALDKIFDVVNGTDFDKIDGWLKKRLSDFLGKTIVFEQLEKIKVAINKLREKGKEFYQKGYAALQQKYQAEFHYTFQKTTTKTALIDATFDFGNDAETAGTLLKLALNGEFNEILSKQLDCIKLNKGSLTHEIKRNTHLEIALPYFKFAVDHINQSITEGDVVDGANGKLWVFNLKAQDTVKKKNQVSKLSIAANLSKTAGVREFSKKDFSFDYVLRLTRENARREYFEHNLDLLVSKYLPTEFGVDDKPPFSEYLTSLDKKLDLLGIPGDNFYGNALTSLGVGLSGEVLSAWENAPSDKKHPIYMQISRRVQELLRAFIPLSFIKNIDHYRETAVIYPLLAYSALPPMNKVKLTSDGLLKFSEDDLYWDSTNRELRSALLRSLGNSKLVTTILPPIQKELGAVNTKQLYENQDIPKIISLSTSDHTETRFNSLIFRERTIIEKIVQTGIKYRKFLVAEEFAEAVKELTEFGEFVTEAFNKNIGGIYSGEQLRPLGSLIFLEVSRILDPSLKVQPLAMLELYFLKDDSTFDINSFLDGKRPSAEQTILQQRIVNVGSEEI